MSVATLSTGSSKKKQMLPCRFVTAASLFDGHDAAINIMRRILQSQGAEVIHLGHDRSVGDIVAAAIDEDAHGIAISSYQGGHVEFFSYMVELLKEKGRPDIKVFGGGGGTITDKEIELLHDRGVERLYSVEDGRSMGLVGMIRDMMERAIEAREEPTSWEEPSVDQPETLARTLSWIENRYGDVGDPESDSQLKELREALEGAKEMAPVLGITGTGGAGKSSLTDELLRRFLTSFPERRVAVLSVDPSRRRTGGALLGDRIRMNSASDDRVFMRSMATREAHASVANAVRDAISTLRASGYDLVILETAGIGQSGTEVVDLSDLALYVMTPEFGAPSQLEKIDMLDFADLVAINKADKRGADDALRYVRKQVQRNRQSFDTSPEQMPVYLCTASRFGDSGVNTLFDRVMSLLEERTEESWTPESELQSAPDLPIGLPSRRARYLSEVSEAVKDYRERVQKDSDIARRANALERAAEELDGDDETSSTLSKRKQELVAKLHESSRRAIEQHEELVERYTNEQNSYSVRGRTFEVDNYRETLSGNQVPRVALPHTDEWGEIVRWRGLENIPGEFPFTAGVFPFKRDGEEPTRMFAGEGTPERTNRRFHYLSEAQPAKRLSTAFDSVTLYGRDPAKRPDIYGKVGNSGVSVPTLDDAKRLYSGFDLTAKSTSVSMTINGPAPMILAFYFNTAIDQAVERRLKETGRWDEAQEKIEELIGEQPGYRADELPSGHDGSGLGLLGVSGDQLIPEEEYEEIRAEVLSSVRGTVQADIFKEDQAQNTCIFSTDFALKMMGDIQEYFVEHDVRNFYSVSISGYHIAEAGANPITQLAFTLANGFTIVEYFRARGMEVDDFARNLSFFFSNGIDPEYAVIGRVARRIWSIAMRDIYDASERSQKLKYHIQTSGRSLHAQEIDFNDIRTTLQAFYAIADNCNSLHTNAYDEAITTPTEESVRRALAIQLILNREFGLLANENPLQGAYVIEELTEIVEDAILAEFERLTDRGGVLGAMETMYQRSRIQEESLTYEHKKHSGEIPVIGVNTFVREEGDGGVVEVEMARSSDDEKDMQIDGIRTFHERKATESKAALERLQQVALSGGNIFAELMETVKCCSLGQITDALFEVGGQYRRNM
jgi:methylmalonyl-CoA mutase